MGDDNRASLHALRLMPLFQGIWPLQTSRIPKDVLAGVTLTGINIPQSLGYTRNCRHPCARPCVPRTTKTYQSDQEFRTLPRYRYGSNSHRIVAKLYV